MAREMPLRQLSNGFFNPIGVLFAVTAFSCSVGKFPLRAPRKGDPRATLSGKEIMTSQSFTFIDPAGNQAQYTVYDADRHNEYHWSTDHGDRGFDSSYAQAQDRARTALKSSMAVRRKSGQRHQ
jgi:hypothetical protein